MNKAEYVFNKYAGFSVKGITNALKGKVKEVEEIVRKRDAGALQKYIEQAAADTGKFGGEVSEIANNTKKQFLDALSKRGIKV